MTLITSADGGVTWRDFITLEAGGSLAGASGGIPIIWDAAENWQLATVTEDGEPRPLTLSPGIAPNDVRAWDSGSGVRLISIDEDRKTVLDAATGPILATAPIPSPFQFVHIQGFTPGYDGRRLTVGWSGPGDVATADRYLGFVDVDTGKFAAVYRWKATEDIGSVWLSGWIADGVAVGRAELDAAAYLPGQVPFMRGVPAIINFNSGVIAPIADFVEELARKAGGPVPLEVESGNFARVTTDGSCLNVRTDPDAGVFACYTDNVLLKLRGGDHWSGGTLWAAVTTPDGRDGWVATQYLQAATTAAP